MFNNLDFSAPYKKTWLKQAGNLFMSDLVGSVVEAGMVSQMTPLEARFPKFSSTVIDTITPTARYFQEPIEWVLDHAKNFEGEEFQEKRKSKSKEERAKSIAHAVVHYGVPISVGWATTLGTERVLCLINKAPHLEGKFWFQDAAIHLGLIGLMGTPMLAPATSKAKDLVNVVSKVFGANDEQAEDIARLSILSALPNYTTFGIVASQTYKHHKALANELNAASSLSKTLG